MPGEVVSLKSVGRGDGRCGCPGGQLAYSNVMVEDLSGVDNPLVKKGFRLV